MRAPARTIPVFQLLASLALIIASLYWARTVLIPVALALLLTFLLSPIASALQRRGLRRAPAVILVVLLLFSCLGGIGWAITAQMTTLAAELPRYEDNIRQKIADIRWARQGSIIETIQTAAQKVMDELQKKEKPAGQAEQPVPVVVQGPSVLWQLPSAVEPLATAGMVMVLVIFMLLEHGDLRNRLLALAGYGRLTVATKALDEAGERISRYLLIQSILNGSFGFAVGGGLFLIGLPHAVVWGVLAAVLRFIPYVGTALAIVLPAALSLAVFQGWLQPILVIALFAVLELVNYTIMEPLLYGQSAGVSPVALLVAVAFWTWLWGPVGLVLATPLTVCLVVLGKYVPQLAFIGVLMGHEPVLKMSTSYYQRLVARDQDEAAEIVEEQLKTQAPEEIYDAVLVPALAAAKRDRERHILTEDEWRFIVQATREIVEDLDTHQPQAATPSAEAAAALVDAPVAVPLSTVRIVACPARDEADELALVMVQRLLDPSRYSMEVVGSTRLTAEVVASVEEQRPGLVCIGALAPGGVAQTRHLCKRLRARFPELKLVVGRWGVEADNEERRPLRTAAGVDLVGMTLLETRNQLMQLSQLLPGPAPASSPPDPGPTGPVADHQARSAAARVDAA
jgi:predicted PurR-regulated permease PerM